jgi:pyruvate dehydrogenase E2 component (dihydrolipoamide acetyltransferase)
MVATATTTPTRSTRAHAETCPQKPAGTKGIQVGSTIAIVGEEGDDLAGADKLAAEGDDAPAVIPHEDDPAPKKEESKKEAEPAKPEPKGDAEVSSKLPAKKASQVGADKPTFFASPLARKIALEKGIPLGQIKGTGPDGRIVEVCVELLAKSSVANDSGRCHLLQGCFQLRLGCSCRFVCCPRGCRV